jgi:RNase P/RNase MRP subunit POP5
MIHEIRKQCQHLFEKDCKTLGIYLIRFKGEQGIVKCNHVEKEKTIKLLESIKQISSAKVKIETLGTSGTIKSLIKKHMSQ